MLQAKTVRRRRQAIQAEMAAARDKLVALRYRCRHENVVVRIAGVRVCEDCGLMLYKGY